MNVYKVSYTNIINNEEKSSSETVVVAPDVTSVIETFNKRYRSFTNFVKKITKIEEIHKNVLVFVPA